MRMMYMCMTLSFSIFPFAWRLDSHSSLLLILAIIYQSAWEVPWR